MLQIRGAFYQVVSALCQTHTALVIEKKDKFCAAVLYSIDETCPYTCPALWEAVLHVTTSVQVVTEPHHTEKCCMTYMYLAKYACG